MQIVNGFPSTMQDDYQLNMINIIRHATRCFGRQEIVTRKPGGLFRYTYREAYERIKRLANALGKLGIGVGDRVGVLEWNTYRFYEMDFGIPGTGAVLLQLNLRLAPKDLVYVINHAGAKCIFVDETLVPLAEAIAPMCPTVKNFVVLTDKPLREVKTKLNPVHSYEELLAGAEPAYEWPDLDEKSAYACCYTTGTTGDPKGVYYSHRNVYLHSHAIALNAEISYRDCFFQIVPMFHANGWGTPQAATLAGAKLLFPGRYAVEDLAPLVDLWVQEKATVADGAPAIFLPMLRYIERMPVKPDLTGARLLSGATEPPVALMKGLYDLTGAEVIHAYGATETTPLVTINRLKPWLQRELTEEQRWDIKRKQGYAVVGLDLKIIDESGKELPDDGKSVGEIVIKGPWITAKYFNAPGTEVQFTPDGYWRSGDAGTMDEEGYVKITDRVKDLIKSGGEWISSTDMENELISHPAVLEAAVTGINHPKWEERPLALLVLKEEFKGQVKFDDFLQHLGQKFAKWQLPDEILFIEAIPKTSVGKIDKKVIRQQYQDFYMKR
ncbi:MAG: long-chain fatty acid--CoA ligase [Syntrophales bacterium]|nr:long-chain fatty acid--CoA ligase [Syntrophales bacterium]MDD5531662.1 long-chain fatty acid--CoA ligase [Syntrophales bacterium]